MSVYEAVMQNILARLEGSPSLCDNVRRSHKVAIRKEDAPAVYLAEADDDSKGGPGDNCRTARQFQPIIRVFVREDNGYAIADALVTEIVARLNPEAPDQTPYPAGVTPELNRVAVAEEIADGDALMKEIRLIVNYQSGYWSLVAAA